jgi:dihydrofolate synthase/folylpolyglutamate synthase
MVDKKSTRTSYHGCLEEMYNLRRFGIKLGLGTIQTLLAELGNPQNSFQSIHIAGTNGKGSVASTLAAVLIAAGYRVGLYTSPHLIRFNERICIDNQPIDDDAVIESYRAVRSVGGLRRQATFFEYTTAMALYQFGHSQVDWAVIETGMGGRLDATNIINPEVSIITNISLEHRAYLGNTIAQIASEKGGIIKPNTPVVTGIRQPRALAVIEGIAAHKKAPLFRLTKEFRVRRTPKETFSYFGIDNHWKRMQTGLVGDHQIENAALVLSACELINRKSAKITIEKIRSAMVDNRWPGRLEVVSNDPMVILDGAHNIVAAKTLARYLRSRIKKDDLTMVVGILDDKPYRAMLTILLPVCKRVILTRPRIDRALNPRRLATLAGQIVDQVEIMPEVGTAFRYAINNAKPGETVCVAGSLYVVGEVKEYLEKNRDGRIFG